MMTIKQLKRGKDAQEKVKDAMRWLELAKENRIYAKKLVRASVVHLQSVEKDEEMAEVELQKARQESMAVREEVLGGWRKAWAKTWEGVK